MITWVQGLARWGFLFARSKDGFDQEEAKKLFFQFRSKGSDPLSNQKNVKTPSSEPQDEDPQSQMLGFMRETAEKLDKIETDIDYLKKQVDTILEKL